MVKIKHFAGGLQITLTPNRSMSWRHSMIVVAAIAVFCLSIAIVWFFLGAWLILPFAGLEVGLLLVLAYLVSKATYQQQVLLLNDKHVSFHSGFPVAKLRVLLQKKTAELNQYETTHPEDVFPLFIKDARQQVRIGEFLNLDDLNKLIKTLGEAGIAHRLKKDVISIAL